MAENHEAESILFISKINYSIIEILKKNISNKIAVRKTNE